VLQSGRVVQASYYRARAESRRFELQIPTDPSRSPV
jgi:hypothetical protein